MLTSAGMCDDTETQKGSGKSFCAILMNAKRVIKINEASIYDLYDPHFLLIYTYLVLNPHHEVMNK